MSKVTVFIQNAFKDSLTTTEFNNLKADFKSYKEEGLLPDTFGRDVLYDHPSNFSLVKETNLSHIHIKDGNTNWHVGTLQFSRTSDSHLIYCQGFYQPDNYLLMAMLAPNAHEQAFDNSIMYNLALMADKFRDQY